MERLSSFCSTWYGKLFWCAGGFAAICGLCNKIQKSDTEKRMQKQKKQQEVSIETEEIVVFEAAR